MLLHPAIKGEANDPPAAANEGDCWLAGDLPTGAWADHAGDLACLQSGNWVFTTPRNGLRVYDEGAGQNRLYVNGWQLAADVAAPAGGSVMDAEARTAIGGLIAALIAAGVLAQS